MVNNKYCDGYDNDLMDVDDDMKILTKINKNHLQLRISYYNNNKKTLILYFFKIYNSFWFLYFILDVVNIY